MAACLQLSEVHYKYVLYQYYSKEVAFHQWLLWEKNLMPTVEEPKNNFPFEVCGPSAFCLITLCLLLLCSQDHLNLKSGPTCIHTLPLVVERGTSHEGRLWVKHGYHHHWAPNQHPILCFSSLKSLWLMHFILNTKWLHQYITYFLLRTFLNTFSKFWRHHNWKLFLRES